MRRVTWYRRCPPPAARTNETPGLGSSVGVVDPSLHELANFLDQRHASLLLDDCPGCAGGAALGTRGSDGSEVPMVSISSLADLGVYLEYTRPGGRRSFGPRRR